MPRPATPFDHYRRIFYNLLDSGEHVRDISPTRFCALSGGQYARAAHNLQVLKNEYAEKKGDLKKIPPQPEWFSRFVHEMTESTRAAAANQWATLSAESDKQVHLIRQKFEETEQQLKQENADYLEQLNNLDNTLETAQDRLVIQQGKIEKLSNDLAKSKGENLANMKRITDMMEKESRYSQIEKTIGSLETEIDFIRRTCNEQTNDLNRLMKENAQLKQKAIKEIGLE